MPAGNKFESMKRIIARGHAMGDILIIPLRGRLPSNNSSRKRRKNSKNELVVSCFHSVVLVTRAQGTFDEEKSAACREVRIFSLFFYLRIEQR